MINPGPRHWHALQKLLKYLKHTQSYSFCYKRLVGNQGIQLFGWTDADWGGDKDTRKSTSGFVFCLAGAAVSWQSKKQSTVALLSTEAEFVAAAVAAKEALWIRRFMKELTFDLKLPMSVKCDNQSCIILTKELKHREKTKHVDFKYYFIRDLIEEHLISLDFTHTSKNWADFLTKPVARQKQLESCEQIGLSA
eukprot:c28294_g1_i10 orf=154-735(-)